MLLLPVACSSLSPPQRCSARACREPPCRVLPSGSFTPPAHVHPHIHRRPGQVQAHLERGVQEAEAQGQRPLVPQVLQQWGPAKGAVRVACWRGAKGGGVRAVQGKWVWATHIAHTMLAARHSTTAPAVSVPPSTHRCPPTCARLCTRRPPCSCPARSSRRVPTPARGALCPAGPRQPHPRAAPPPRTSTSRRCWPLRCGCRGAWGKG